jgi:hypothetical protein
VLKDHWHSEKLLPKVQAWLQTHQAQLANVRHTAIRELEQEAPAIMPDPIAEQAKGIAPEEG